VTDERIRALVRQSLEDSITGSGKCVLEEWGNLGRRERRIYRVGTRITDRAACRRWPAGHRIPVMGEARPQQTP
jgi:hypothetical protein